VDHQFRASDLFSARYYINDAGIENHGTFGIPESDPNANFTDVRAQSILGSYTHIFRPSLVNDLKVTFFQRKFIVTLRIIWHRSSTLFGTEPRGDWIPRRERFGTATRLGLLSCRHRRFVGAIRHFHGLGVMRQVAAVAVFSVAGLR